MKLGILASDLGTTLTPYTINQDWTGGSLPTDWSANPNDVNNHPVFDGTGAYWDSTGDPVWAGQWSYFPATSHNFTSSTTIIKYVITDLGSFSGEFGVVGSDLYLGFIDNGIGLSTSLSNGASLAIPMTVTGDIYVAITVADDGTAKGYLFDDSGSYTDTDSGAAPTSNTLNYFDIRSFTETGESAMKTVKSYHSINEVLDSTAITAIVTGWGWTP